ncbi:MAG: hypothetical protein AUH86_08440 [Acidobacteria bacterium 13_1_40CM_4_58_4]|nr:MAG: hypothetical protein AUH86_08440 [Acidobacteria bacterium 13_1_40CM_4_58_4]
MTDSKNSRKVNGHAGPNGRPNGHGPASTERGGVPVHRGRAASDDASGVPIATAAASTVAAGTAREAYAEVAPPAPNGAARILPESTSPSSDQGNKEKQIPPGEKPLPADVEEFVQEIHHKIDITEVWHGLLRHGDDKIRQRAVERLTDLLYKGAATSGEEPQQIIFDLPRPKRD